MNSGDWLEAIDAASAAAALVVSQRGCASAMPTPAPKRKELNHPTCRIRMRVRGGAWVVSSLLMLPRCYPSILVGPSLERPGYSRGRESYSRRV